MKTRAVTGVVFVAVMLGAMLLGVYVYLFFFTALSAWCLYEFYGIVSSDQRKPNIAIGIIFSIFLFTIGSLVLTGFIEQRYFFVLLPLTVLVYICALFRKRIFPFDDIAYTFLGNLYVSIPFFFFTALGFLGDQFDSTIPLGFMLLLWSNDTGAYLVGRRLGKHKLFERISPKKTWEGFIGGLLFALLVSLILQYYFPVLACYEWVSIALLIGIFGTLGDLVESMLKRSLHVKDSGNILPGHGGFLDRFDGLLVAAPIVYCFLIFVK